MVRTILVAIALQAGVANAESAVLECISSIYASGKAGGTTFVQFRMTAAPDWKVSSATLILHSATETQPASVEVGLVDSKWNEFDSSVAPVAGKTRKYSTTALKDGWIKVDLDPAQAQLIRHGLAVIVPGGGKERPFHLRDSMHFSPYLLLEGTRKESE